MKQIFKDYKVWALITGAASGMGRIYAGRLALMGYNVALVDINAGGLDETASIVRESVVSSDRIPEGMKKSFKVMTIVQDLSLADAADSVHARTSEAGCAVEVLVNNAGIMYCQAIPPPP